MRSSGWIGLPVTSADKPRVLRELPATRPAVLTACRAVALDMQPHPGSLIGITSAIAGEGRTTIARGLAQVIRADYRLQVLLVDYDLETAGLTQSVGGAGWPGLAEIVRGEATLDDAVQPLSDDLSLISPGIAGSAGPRLMVEAARLELMKQFAAVADVVIADLPPILTSNGRAAAESLSELLMVIRSGVTPLARLKEAIELMSVEPRVLLNGSSSALPRWLRRLMDL